MRTAPTIRDGLDLRIDKDEPTPVYLQLRDRLARAVAAGLLPPGTALPSERDLARRLALSRMTVRRSLEALVHDGLVERRHGSGTYVCGDRVEQTVGRVLGFTDEARALGVEPGTRLLEVRHLPGSPRIAEALGVREGTEVLAITRLRTADGVPLAIQSAYLPPSLAGLSLELLRERESLYATLREQYGVVPYRARQTVTARLPDAHERRWLGLGPGSPVLALERSTSAGDGAPLEYVRSAYRGDRYRLALDLNGADPARAPAPAGPRRQRVPAEEEPG